MKNPAKISKRIFAYALVISLLISSDSFYAFASIVTNSETTKSDLHTASSNQFIELDDGNTDIDELGKYEDEEPQGDPEDFIYHDLTNQPIGGTVKTDKGEMTWSINSTGKLTVTGKGQPKLETKHVQYYRYSDLYSRDIDNCWPWAEYQHDIKSAYVDLSEFSSAENMFLTCSNLSKIEFGDNFDTSNVTNMESMFDGCRALTTLDLTSFNTSNVSDMSYMFEACDSLTELDLSSFDTSNVSNMSFMFYYCDSLTGLDLSSFDTSDVTNMAGLFCGCYELTSLPFNSWNNFVTNNVSDMSYMFYSCESLTELDLSSFDTSSVSDMSFMFDSCESLTELVLSSFDTSSVSNMGQMFNCCDSLTELDLSSFNLIKLEYSGCFFPINCNLSLIIAPANLSNTIYLPNTGDWMAETGEIINILPLNQSKPIVIQKDVDVAPGAYNPVEIKTEIDKG